jgi:anaphase-promoting complex subunit 6
MRGRAYEALENRSESRKWFERALRTDPHCYEALEFLLDNYMLPASDGKLQQHYRTFSLRVLLEQNLVQELQFESGEEWLRQIYSLKTQKYAQHELILPAIIATANMGK